MDIKGLVVLEPEIYSDERGFFFEVFSKRKLLEKGIDMEFVQCNHSKSQKGVLRGLHFQRKRSQSKLIRVLSGAILDIAVDLRKNSETFGKNFKIELSAENRKMLYIPKGFAHGFLSLSENTEIEYFCDEFYASEYDDGIIWSDEELEIDWDLEKYSLKKSQLIISKKDNQLQSFKEFLKKGGEIE